MNTCKTCKWWGWLQREPGGPMVDDQYTHISGEIDGVKLRACWSPNNEETSWPDKLLKPAAQRAQLHKSIDTSLVTGPEFGCVNWEAKA